ncbi:MAG TPA: hypothetical protein DIT01_13665, partial [Lentisphaeria bacterium]|nr:hypothetical protein [Lentisphaeria bacterium]
SIETGPEGNLDLDGDTALTLATGADLTAGGDITVNDNLLLDNPNGDSTVTSEDGDITLQNVAAVEIRNLTVTAAEGTVTIGSLGSADGDDTNDANNLTITAANVLLDNTANGRIEGNLTITATGDVDNNDNGGGGTELNVDGAASIAGNNVDLDGGLVVTGSVTVTALQDIGIGLGTVAQGNVTSGGNVSLTADLDLDGDGGVEMNSADLVSTAGNITITGQGVVVDDVDATAGTITIEGLAGGIAAQTPGDVVADLAAINIDLDATGPINVETDASDINAATDGVAGSIIINNVGAGPIVFAGTTTGEDADITLAHTGAGLLTVNDTKASSGDVAIAGGGAIQVNRIDAEDGGATNGITDDAQTVRVTSTGAGDITIAEGDVDADPTNGRTGGISADFALTVLNADGDIDLNSESIFSAGSVDLDSTTGSISDISGGDRVNIRALGSATLIADDEVGNLTDILEVNVGELLVSANSGDADSGFATGLGGLADGSIGPRYVNFIGDAPGLLVWNGDVIGGPPAELQLWLRAGNFDSQGVMLDNTSQVFRNPFFYHKAVMLSDYRAPTTVLEYISASGGKIFGLPRHLALSNNIDILQYTDDPYSWDLEIRRRRDKSRRD